jgi:quinol monooxygenase YgiN
MTKVTLKGHILVPDKDLESVRRALPRHIKNTLAETGCLSFEIIPDKENVNRFFVFEEFKDMESFKAHQNRVATSEWGAVSVGVERHYEITGG